MTPATESAKQAANHSTIVVVSGLPRSGTSLMMQMLEAAGIPPLADDRRPPDVSNPRGYYELEAVKATGRDASWIDQAPGHAVKVIHMLLDKLPRDRRYRVILMERDLAEVLASQQKMLERLNPADRHRQDPNPQRLEDIFKRQLAAARSLLDETPCFERLTIPYSELVQHPVAWAREVTRFLDLSVEPDLLAQVVDPALYRSRGS